MIRKVITIFGVCIGIVLILGLLFFAKTYWSTTSRINTVYNFTPQSIQTPTDSAQIADGARLIVAKGCIDCHATDLGGKVFIDDPGLGKFAGKNLTKGKGGSTVDYSTSDWVLALRHGIRKNGKPLLFMPAHEYNLLTEQDLASIIAYAQQIPNVDRVLPDNKLGPLTYILADLDMLPLLPVEMIDHSRPLTKEIKAEVSIEFGRYLSTLCQGCHRQNMKGGKPLAPGLPAVADITRSGNPGKWTEEQFMTTLRTGKTPEGKILDASEMPWPMTAAYTDTELKALYLYLSSLVD
jgi:mono/diheme cytochrome c family protein